MVPEQRISAFVSLRNWFKTFNETNADFFSIQQTAEHKNPWFTKENVLFAIQSLTDFLSDENLHELSKVQCTKPKRIALILEGKIPFDGITDAICILLSGNILLAKIAETDKILCSLFFAKLKEFQPEFSEFIEVHTSILPQFDAIIASAENKTFNTYVERFPHVLRPKQTSVAIITGHETTTDLQKLGFDMFRHFGNDSRNVSHLFIPQDFQETKILDAVEQFNSVAMHYKYMNNYEYNKSIYLVAQKPHLDNGFLILKEDENLHSPLGVIFYERYATISEIQDKIGSTHEIHIVACADKSIYKNSVPFGTTNQLRISDCKETIHLIKNL